MRQIQAGETVALRRRIHFHLVGTDGITPANGEAGGQPQVNINDGGWANTGISTLLLIGNGRYYATLTQDAVGAVGSIIETRYKSATTAECPGDSVHVTASNPDLLIVQPAPVQTVPQSPSSGDASLVFATDVFTVGDTLTPAQKLLRDRDGQVIDLAGATIQFRMAYYHTGVVKVDNAAAVKVQNDADSSTYGRVRYNWSSSDVDSPGIFRAWFIVTQNGKTEHFPATRDWLIQFKVR